GEKTEGLAPHEVAVLALLLSESAAPSDSMSAYQLKQKLQKSGYTAIAASIAAQMLARKEMVEFLDARDPEQGYEYTACRLTEKGLEWLSANQDRFGIRIDKEDPEIP